MKPRVLFLDHTAVMGGAEFFLLELAARYDGPKEVVLLSDGPLRRLLERRGVGVTIIGAGSAVAQVSRAGRGWSQFKALFGLGRLAWLVAKKAKNFDLVFANSQKSLVVSAMARLFSRRPLVWYLHDIITADHFSSLNRRVCVMLANRFVTRVVTNSEASREAFMAGGGKSQQTAVVYNGLSETRDAFVKPASELRSELGFNAAPIIASFSRLAPWKGQHVFLEALGRMPGVQGLIVGAPLFGQEAQYEAELKAQAERLGLTARVRFLGFREDVPALLAMADVVVHTAVAPEPFGRVIVEGMLARKPVVATRAGGACEIIEDGVTGRLVTPGDSTELARVIGEMLNDPDRMKTLGEAGYASARKRFSVQTMMAGMQQQFEEAMRL